MRDPKRAKAVMKRPESCILLSYLKECQAMKSKEWTPRKAGRRAENRQVLAHMCGSEAEVAL